MTSINEHNKVSTNTLLFSGVVFVILFSVLFVALYMKDEVKQEQKVVVTESSIAEQPKEDYFKDISLEAQAVYVFDVNSNRVLFAQNAESQMPLASLTKIMTAFTASKIAEAKDTITIKPRDILIEGDSGLVLNETWPLKKILDFGLMVSSNDAMSAIAGVLGARLQSTSTEQIDPHSIFIKRMNDEARALGMSQSYFLNESGLDVSSALSGGYGSAEDITKLVQHVLKYDRTLLEATEYDSLSIPSDSREHLALNTNKIINTIPGILGSKTGYTDLSGGNLVIAFNAGLMDPVIITVLGSTREGRFTDMEQLINATLKTKAQ